MDIGSTNKNTRTPISKKWTGGFTLLEIMITIAIIALLAALSIPFFVKARSKTQTTQITSNIKLINTAIEQYSMERGLDSTDNITLKDAQEYIYGNIEDLTWPSDTSVDGDTTRAELSIIFDGKLYTCDHPEGIDL